MGRHIKEGREHLNFSRWDQVPIEKRPELVREMVEEIREGEMPTWDYLLLHPEARLRPQDIALLEQALAQGASPQAASKVR